MNNHAVSRALRMNAFDDNCIATPSYSNVAVSEDCILTTIVVGNRPYATTKRYDRQGAMIGAGT
jgi:hypothetical protein